MDYASAAIRSNCDFASFLPINYLIVLVQHVIEGLIDILKIKKDNYFATLHAQDNVINDLVNGFFLFIFLEITSIENLI